MKTTLQDWIGLAGRILMSAIFIYGGYRKAMAPSATMATFAHLGLPLPGAAYSLALVVEVGVGVLFLVGFRARLMALILGVWCVATAMVAHYHPESRDAMTQFYKNVGMAGGFLQVVAYGAGRFSFDRG
jgi:putative oxidoreductase